MIIGSRKKLNIGDRIEVIGPHGRAGSGVLPAVILRFATMDEYLEDMKDYQNHIPDYHTLNTAYYYEVSVD